MGRNIEQAIVIKADVQATLSGMNEVVNKLNQGLREGMTKVDLTKGVGLSLSKQIDKYKTELGKFSELTKGNKVEFADSTEAIKSGENLIKTFREIRRIVGDFDDLTIIDAKKIFPEAFDSRVSELQKDLSKLGEALSKLENKRIDLNTAKSDLEVLRKQASDFQTLMNQEVSVKVELNQAKEAVKTFGEDIEKIRAKAEQGINLKIKTTKQEAADASNKKAQIWSQLGQNGLKEEDFSGSTVSGTKFKGKSASAWEKQATKKDGSESSKAEAQAALEAINAYNQQKGALIELGKIIKQKTDEVDQLTESLSKMGKMNLSEAVRISGGSEDDIQEANDALRLQEQALKESAEAQAKYNLAHRQAKGAADGYEKTNAKIKEQENLIEKITLSIKDLEQQVGTEELTKAFNAAGVKDFSAEMLKSADGVKQLREKLEGIDESSLTKLKKELKDMGINADAVEEALRGVKTVVGQVDEGAKDIKKTASEIDNLKNQVLQFFSLTNAVQLFKRAVTSAMNTVKELDATMTEAAVVTEFDIGDMWDKLPEYSANAQKLGVSINGMYQATTLYYQQGLKTNEAMALGVETMKMAKIAGMESAEATTAMTAALRGFNMELNEASATRVNDVYSQLAAVTAADTEQIATAMSKTASIASAANMEFETTAALLAQIIETTQEAPETAGTAMKTIIARFSEVKELKNQGLTTGKDEEGEDIDVNKIQTALRTVGISMEGYFQGTEGLDSILLKLSEKWDSLDVTTQRYIATMAAGSRQQSRFIAMMSDYGRTTELVNEAQNSAGASQRQFEKTQDSLASSLQKLKNAWDEFLMGLANNEVLKFAVDSLTFIVTAINKIIDVISGGNGLIKSITSLMGVIGALKLGKSLFNSAGFGNILGAITGNKQGTTEVIDRKTTTPEGNIVEEHIVKNPQAQGDQAGQKAGAGFIAGFKRAIDTGKSGGGFLAKTKSFFVSDELREETNKKKASNAKAVAQRRRRKEAVTAEKKEAGSGKMALMSSIVKDNVAKFDSDGKQISGLNPKQIGEIKAEYEKVYEATNDVAKASEAAMQKTESLGGSLLNAGEKAKLAGNQAKTTGVDFQALGGAVQGLGGAIGALALLFEAIGWEEGAEGASVVAASIMGIGTALTALPSLISTVGAVATAAGISTQAAWWWLIIILAVIVAIIAAIALIGNAWEKSNDQAQLEKMTEQLENLSAAADEAKQKLEDMASAKDKLEGMRETLSNLHKGTREWKQALIENNQQVLELLSTYSELSSFVTNGANGELIIAEEGWDMIMDKQSDIYTSTLVAESAMAQQVEEKQFHIQIEETLGEAVGGEYKMDWAEVKGTETKVEQAQTGGLTYDQFTNFSALAFERGLNYASGSLDYHQTETLLRDLRIEADASEVLAAVQHMGLAFDELAASAMTVKQAELARVDATMQSIGANSEKIQNSAFGEVAMDTTAQAYDNFDVQVEEAAKQYTYVEGKGTDEENNAKLISTYASYKGADVGELTKAIEEGTLSYEQMAKELGARDVTQKAEKSMEASAKTWEKISKGKSQTEMAQLQSLATNGGENLTLDAYEQINSFMKKGGSLDQYLQQQGFDDTIDYQAMGFESRDDFIQAQELNWQVGSDSLMEAARELQNAGVSLQTLPSSLSAEAARGLASKVSDLKNQGVTDEQITALFSQINQELANVDESTRGQLLEQLALTDWGSTTDLQQTQAIWADALGTNTTALNSLFGGIDTLAGAVNKNTLAQQQEGIFQLEDIKNRILQGDLSENVSKAQYDELIKSGHFNESQFKQTGTDQYVFIDGNMYDYVSNKLVQSKSDMRETSQNIVDNKERARDYQNSYQGEMLFSGSSHQEKVFKKDVIEAEEKSANSFFEGYTAQNFIDYKTSGVVKDATGRDITAEMETFFGGKDALNTKIEAFYNDPRFFDTINVSDTIASYTQEEFITGLQQGTLDLSESSEFDNYYASLAEKMGLSEEDIQNATYEDKVKQILDWEKKYQSEDVSEEAMLEAEKTNAQNIGGGVLGHNGMISTYDYTTDKQEYQGEANASFEEGLDTIITGAGATQRLEEMRDRFAEVKEEIPEDQLEHFDRSMKVLTADMSQAEKRTKNFVSSMSNLKDSVVANKRGTDEYNKAIEMTNKNFTELLGVDEKAIADAGITQEEYEAIVAGDADTFASVTKRIQEAALKGYAQAQLNLDSLPQPTLNFIMGFEGSIDGEALKAQLGEVAKDIDLTTQEGQAKMKELFGIVGTSMEFEVTGEGKDAKVTVVASKADYGDIFNKFSGRGGGGGGGKNYENGYDKLHNTLEEINDTIRERERLERAYQRLLDQNVATAEKLAKISRENVQTQREEIARQKAVKAGRISQIEAEIAKNSSLGKYVQVVEDEYGDKSIRIDWEQINTLKNSDTGEKLDEFYSNLDTWLDSIYEADTAIADCTDAIYQEMLNGKDDYLSLEDQIKQAIIDERQKEIDELSTINDSINDTNGKLIESIQSSVDKYRQDRENEKTEEEISDKQRRLAYLQQDTSGANATEILNLQKEIDEAQEDYTDTLIDQKISELQEQNDKAAEQRQQQIDLMQAQLDQYAESEEIWNEVVSLIQTGTSATEGLITGSDLDKLLRSSAAFEGMSKIQKMDWLNQTNNQIAGALKWLSEGAVTTMSKGGKITFATGDVDSNGNRVTVTGTVNDQGEVITDEGVYSGVTMDAYGNFSTSETQAEAKTEKEKRDAEEKARKEAEREDAAFPHGRPSKIVSELKRGTYNSAEVGVMQWALHEMGLLGEPDNDFGPNTERALKAFQSDKTQGDAIGYPEYGKLGPKTKDKFAKWEEKRLAQFKTGGLADFTGPAWLDGTKSRPEYILNADQTKAFFNLVDVLGSLQSGDSKTTQNSGDNTYDIDINVESIGSDYDVEQLADTVKRLINEDARYRNNNAINLMR